jgi:hypothetical protein
MISFLKVKNETVNFVMDIPFLSADLDTNLSIFLHNKGLVTLSDYGITDDDIDICDDLDDSDDLNWINNEYPGIKDKWVRGQLQGPHKNTIREMMTHFISKARNLCEEPVPPMPESGNLYEFFMSFSLRQLLIIGW